MKNIIYSNKEEFLEILENIKKDGAEKLHILSDFDNTLTKAFVDRIRTPSFISVLRNFPEILGEEFAIEDTKLFEKYYNIEKDSSISMQEKISEMKKWWIKTFELLIKSGLKKYDCKKVVELGNIEFRKGVIDFFKYLNKKNNLIF